MFVVYGRDDCKYCRMSKKALVLTNEDFVYVSLEDKPNIREELREQGFETIPAIFYQDGPLGGYDQLHGWITEKYLK